MQSAVSSCRCSDCVLNVGRHPRYPIPLVIPLFRVGNLLRQISGQGREFKFSESQKALFEVKRAIGIRTLLIKVLQQLILSDSRVNFHSA